MQAAGPALRDPWQRPIEYLRLSLTERCDFRCLYCRTGAADPAPRRRPLAAAEIVRIVGAAAQAGIRKVRLTGGEPLLRPDIRDIVAGVAGVPGVADLALTTNGSRLAGLAAPLKAAGLGRVNVSLDSLDPAVFRRVTGAELAPTLAGVEAALAAGLAPLRLNVVLLRGVNQGEIPALAALADRWDCDVRFIELMPPAGNPAGVAALGLGIDAVPAALPGLEACPESPDSVAGYYRLPGRRGRIGLIAARSHAFCRSCNRLRLSADGRLWPCLTSRDGLDLAAALAEPDAELGRLIQFAVDRKPACHRFAEGQTIGIPMDRLGG